MIRPAGYRPPCVLCKVKRPTAKHEQTPKHKANVTIAEMHAQGYARAREAGPLLRTVIPDLLRQAPIYYTAQGTVDVTWGPEWAVVVASIVSISPPKRRRWITELRASPDRQVELSARMRLGQKRGDALIDMGIATPQDFRTPFAQLALSCPEPAKP